MENLNSWIFNDIWFLMYDYKNYSLFSPISKYAKFYNKYVLSTILQDYFFILCLIVVDIVLKLSEPQELGTTANIRGFTEFNRYRGYYKSYNTQ